MLLEHITVRYKITIHAYCMLRNHYHILMRTHEANLSEAMWYFGMHFARLVNRDINGDGPLFRDRFRSILVDQERYFLQLSRYIHLNPVQAGLVTSPETYPWSSCQYFEEKNKAKAPPFLQIDATLSRFRMAEEYLEFLRLGNSPSISALYAKKKLPTKIS